MEVSNDSFVREYYKVTYDNGSELIFLTSNELDEMYKNLSLREEFIIFFDFKQLIKDFSYIPLMDIYMPKQEHILHFPNYLFYNPEFIDTELSELFEQDLYHRFDETKVRDIDKLKATIKLWKTKLKC